MIDIVEWCSPLQRTNAALQSHAKELRGRVTSVLKMGGVTYILGMYLMLV